MCMVTPLSSQLRHYLVRMVLAVVAVDAVALGLYYGFDVRSAAPRTQALFTGAWTLITLIVVLTGMTRIRAARTRARRGTSA